MEIVVRSIPPGLESNNTGDTIHNLSDVLQ